jgi:ABC-type polysaccharide/polyol phosphate export permease
LVWALRYILLDAVAPPVSLLIKLTLSSVLMLAIGVMIFRRLKPRFYDYL